MSVYQVTPVISGPAKVRKVQDDEEEVIFLFDERGAHLFEQITREGIHALENNPDFAHLLEYTEGKAIKLTQGNAQPGVHAVIFG